MLGAEQFKETILDILEEERWTVPTLLETYNANHMTRDGARVYALEHCVFAANFPRWLTNIAGNCPILEVRQYLIENAFVEEVRDPTITTGHYESLVDFAVAFSVLTHDLPEGDALRIEDAVGRVLAAAEIR